MRRILSGVLAALMLLAPAADAAKLLVIASVNQYAPSFQAEHMSERVALGVLNTLGVDYDFIRAGSARTLWCKTGIRTIGGPGGTTTQTYAGVLHLDFRVDINPAASGYRPDSLTLRAGWPDVPQLFAGVTGTPGTTWTNNFNSCSTGVVTNNSGIAAANQYYKQYLVGGAPVWGPSSVTLIAALQAGGDAAWYGRGVWRAVVGQGVGASNHANGLPLVTSACRNCDSLGRSASPDSVVLWARYRSAVEPAPLIFVDYTGHFASAANPNLFAMGMAMLDSACGGTLITKKMKMAVAIDGTYRTGVRDLIDAGGADTLRTGIYCYADSCDSTNVAATMDSLNSLGIPVSFTVDAESLAHVSMGYHKRLIQRVKQYNVAISSGSGNANNELGIRNAGRYSLHDIFGHTRRREVLPAGTTALPATCTATDTSIYCLLARAKARADSVFRGRVSRVLMPVMGDFTPTTITAANAMALDTLTWALVSLGFRGAVVSLMSNENIVGRTTIPRGPIGWVANSIRLKARKPYASNPSSGGVFTAISSPVIGTFKILPTRGSDQYTSKQNWIYNSYNGAHYIGTEEAHGAWTGHWYYAPDAFHPNHAIDARTRVMRMNATTLGGHGQGTHASRPAWWHIKWTVNQFKAINALAGRSVAEIVTLDELAADKP